MPTAPDLAACPYRVEAGGDLFACRCAQQLARLDQPVACSHDQCLVCEREPRPQNANRVTASIALAAMPEHERAGPVGVALVALLRPMQGKPRAVVEGEGVGAQLVRIFHCQCLLEDHVRQMNAWGPDECERRLKEIVTWLQDRAAQIGQLAEFDDEAAESYVTEAIRLERRRLRGAKAWRRRRRLYRSQRDD